MKILIADDELRFRKVIALFLRKSGHEVTEAASGEQLLELLAVKKPEVVIMDMVMPGCGGVATCKAIKSSEEWKDVPVVMLSANISSAERMAGLEAGASAYLTKPFSPKELLEKLLELTNQGSSR